MQAVAACECVSGGPKPLQIGANTRPQRAVVRNVRVSVEEDPVAGGKSTASVKALWREPIGRRAGRRARRACRRCRSTPAHECPLDRIGLPGKTSASRYLAGLGAGLKVMDRPHVRIDGWRQSAEFKAEADRVGPGEVRHLQAAQRAGGGHLASREARTGRDSQRERRSLRCLGGQVRSGDQIARESAGCDRGGGTSKCQCGLTSLRQPDPDRGRVCNRSRQPSEPTGSGPTPHPLPANRSQPAPQCLLGLGRQTSTRDLAETSDAGSTKRCAEPARARTSRWRLSTNSPRGDEALGWDALAPHPVTALKTSTTRERRATTRKIRVA